MRNPFRRTEMTLKDIPSLLLNELDAQLRDPTSEVRQLLARVARGEAKNHFALQTGNELEMFDRALADRAARVLDSLGSASFDQHAALAVELTAPQRRVADEAIAKAYEGMRRSDG